MTQAPKDQGTPFTLESFWQLLDSKLVSLGVPASLIAVAVNQARNSQWQAAGLSVVGAGAIWLLIKIGNQLAPRLDKLLVWIFDQLEKLVQDVWANATNTFEGKYYERLKYDCREYEIRGINRGALQLESVFVPLQMTQENPEDIPQDVVVQSQKINPVEQQEIGKLLVLMARDIRYQRLAILGAPGCGKSTLLRHITLMYATRRQRRLHRKAPKLVPVLLQLRAVYQDILQQKDDGSQPSLAEVIATAVKKLQESDPLTPPDLWFPGRLRQGKCLVMLDGLDEVADDEQRQQVSQWVDKQIEQYPQTSFILTSRPEAYRKTPLRENILTLEVQPFTADQRNKFIQDWYLHRRKRDYRNKVDKGVRDSAMRQAKELIGQIDASSSLRLMARNPLLLNMIAITHEDNGTLSERRVDLYKEICRVLLEGRQRAKRQPTVLSASQKQLVLESLALKLMQHDTQAFTLDESSTREKTFKAQSLIQKKLKSFPQATISPEEFIKKDELGARELLCDREQEEIYEFAHKTFQEYLAAVAIIKDRTATEQLLLDAFADEKKLSWWRETIRFYAAQTDATHLIKKALTYGTVPVLTLAYQCSQEAQQLEPAVKHQLKAKVEHGLESENRDEFTLAAEVKLAARLDRLNQDLLAADGNPETERQPAIDSSDITWAEYQLFENETHPPGNTCRTLSRKAAQPITGIDFWEANRFCAWLSLRSRKQLGEPGLCYRQTMQAERQQHSCQEDRIRLVRFQVPERYSQLAYYLAAGMWKEADEETDKQMLQVAQREQQGYLDLEDIRQFPCEDLRSIDQLWVQYSDGHFGFSVQKQIYLSMGGRLEGEFNQPPRLWRNLAAPFTKLYEKMGGRIRGDSYDMLDIDRRLYETLGWSKRTFLTTAPKGHLPYNNCPQGTSAFRGVGWLGRFGLLFSRVETCKL